MVRLVLIILLTLSLQGSQTETVKLGFMPYLSAEVLLEKYTPLAAYLSKALDKRVEIVISRDHAEHMERTGTDQLCISFLGGNPYIRVVERYGPKPLLTRFEFDHSPVFRSVIVVAKDSPIDSIGALAGKRFAFGNPDSTLSAQVPRYTLAQAGISLEDLGGYTHLKNHENILYGVLFGDFDAGAVTEEVFKEREKEGIRALAYSRELSTHLFVTRSNMDSKTQEKIRRALLELSGSEEGRAVLRAISPSLTGFVPVKDSDYDPHREIFKTLAPQTIRP